MHQRARGVLSSAVFFALGAIAITPSAALAQAKTAKQCTEEWRANKADNQSKGITEKAYVAQCRSGTAAAQPPAAASPPPSRPATASPPPGARPTTGAAPAGANQFSGEAQAKARCGSDTVVWVNEKSKVYHFAGSKRYGTTKEGTFMCERDAMAAGDRAAKNEKHP
jgi:hypothetical protein